MHVVNWILKALWGMWIFFVLLSCSPEDGDLKAPFSYKETIYTYSSLELEILSSVNSYRRSQRLQELELLDVISIQAEIHNAHMIEAKEVCHHNFGERYRALKESVQAQSIGENVGYGFYNANSLVLAWVNSEHHHKIIMAKNTHFGISARMEEGEKVYVTMIFIRK